MWNRVFQSPAAGVLSRRYVCLQVLTGVEFTPQTWEFDTRYEVARTPTILVLLPNGRLADRRTGFVDLAELLMWLSEVEYFRPSVERLPGHFGTPLRTRRERVDQAHRLVKAHVDAAAIKLLDELIRKQPDDEVLKLRGRIALRSGDSPTYRKTLRSRRELAQDPVDNVNLALLLEHSYIPGGPFTGVPLLQRLGDQLKVEEALRAATTDERARAYVDAAMADTLRRICDCPGAPGEAMNQLQAVTHRALAYLEKNPSDDDLLHNLSGTLRWVTPRPRGLIRRLARAFRTYRAQAGTEVDQEYADRQLGLLAEALER